MSGRLKHFGEYLRCELAGGKIDFALRAHINSRGNVEFYIHPSGNAGDTRDYIIFLDADPSRVGIMTHDNQEITELDPDGSWKT